MVCNVSRITLRSLLIGTTRFLVVLGSVLVAPPLSAADSTANVLVIADMDSSIHQVFIDTLRRDSAIEDTLKVIDIAEFNNNADSISQTDTRLLMPVGVNALNSVINSNPTLPVWAALVPKRSYESLLEHAAEADLYSAWVVDQPLPRRFDLLKLALPTVKRIGVLVGESPENAVQALQDAAVERSLELIVHRVSDEQDAVAQTQKLGETVDAMLAVPDRVSLNLNNAKGILLSAYRQRLPIVGYTRAYVSAGALVAVYSMPEQIAQQVIEEWTMLVPNTQIKSELHYPKYFSVAVNTRVARSLGIQLPSQASLFTRLQEAE